MAALPMYQALDAGQSHVDSKCEFPTFSGWGWVEYGLTRGRQCIRCGYWEFETVQPSEITRTIG